MSWLCMELLFCILFSKQIVFVFMNMVQSTLISVGICVFILINLPKAIKIDLVG